MALTNLQYWELARKLNPNFASHTAEGTADLFTERGYSTITQAGMNTLNEFFRIIMPFTLQALNISHAKDPLDENGFGEYFDQPFGEYIQRMSVDSIKPITPAYRNLTNGNGPDPFVVRKPTTNARFFTKNFDYQSLVTMPDEWMTKRMFVSEYGISEFMAGVFTGLENGYILQKYTNKLEVLNAAINDTTHPLKSSQVYTLTMGDPATEAQLVDFQKAVMNVTELMTTSAQTGGFNAYGFASTQDKGRLHLLVRPGYQANLALDVVRGSYNAQTLNLDLKVDVVPHFGGLVPYKEAAFTTQLYPVYNALGEQIGWNEAADKDTVTVANGAEFWKDPNADVFAILADKGVIFETRQNPYQVEPIRNPRGLYTNYWASSPNNAINYDPLYNMVVFKTTAPEVETAVAKARMK